MSALDAALRTLVGVPQLLVALASTACWSLSSRCVRRRPSPAAVTAIKAPAARPGTTIALVSGRGLADLARCPGSARRCT